MKVFMAMKNLKLYI